METLLFIGLRQRPHPRYTETLLGRGAQVLSPVEEALRSAGALQPPVNQPQSALFLSWLTLLAQSGETIPIEVDDWILRQLNEHPSGVHYEDVSKWLALLPATRSLSLVCAALPGGGSVRTLFSFVQDEQVYWEVIHYLTGERPDRWSSEEFCVGFARGGERALKVLSKALSEKLPAYVLAILAKAVRHIEHPDSLPLLVRLLHHKSKSVRRHAIDGLLVRKVSPPSYLKEALLAVKTSTKEAALEVLQGLPPDQGKDALLSELSELWTQSEREQWFSWLPEFATQGVSEEGPLQLVQQAERSLTKERKRELMAWWDQLQREPNTSESPDVGAGVEVFLCLPPATRLHRTSWQRAVALFQEERLTPWFVVYSIARVEKVFDRWTAQMMKEALGLLGERAIEPMLALAAGSRNRWLFFEQAAALGMEKGLPLLLMALQDNTKRSRDIAIRTLPKLPPEPVLQGTLGLLSHSQKEVREAASRVLGQIGSPLAQEALARALNIEKADVTASLMQQALEACVPGHRSFLLSATEAQLEHYLGQLLVASIPSFLELKRLPTLAFASGRTLGLEATKGWLGLLMRESPQSPQSDARFLRRRLDRERMSTFGEALLRLWLRQGHPSPHKWMFWQMSVSASGSWLYEQHDRLHKDSLPIYAQHGSRLATLLLLTAPLERKLQVLREQALAQIPDELLPDQQTVEMFSQELREIAEDDFGFGADRQQETEEAELWELDLCSFPRLGEAPQELVLHSVGTIPVDEPTKRRCALKRKRLQAVINEHLSRLVEAFLQGPIDRPRWTAEGWRQMFGAHPLWQLVGAGLLFRNELGVTFMLEMRANRGPHYVAADVHLPLYALTLDGERLALAPDDFVWWVRPALLPEAEQRRWQEALDAKANIWQSQRPQSTSLILESELSELRGLLYEAPSPERWEALCDLLESCSGSELELALAYIEAHTTPEWEALLRVAPPRWWRQLLHPDNPALRALPKASLPPGEGRREPRLRACNAILFTDVGLKERDLRCWRELEELSSITSLSLHGGRLYKSAEQMFASLDHLRNVETLWLHQVSVRHKAWPLLFQSTWRDKLKQLHLTHMELDWQLLEALCQSGLMGQLHTLDLRGNQLGLPGIQVLEEHGPFPSLRSLHLRFEDVGEDGLEALSQKRLFPQLRALSLIAPGPYHPTSLGGVSAFAASDAFPCLERLSLFEEEAVSQAFGTAPSLSHHQRRYHAGWINVILQSQTLPTKALSFLRALLAEQPLYGTQ